MRAWINRYGCIQSVKYQRVVIVIPDDISYDVAVIQIQNNAQVYLVNFRINVVFKLCYISPCWTIQNTHFLKLFGERAEAIHPAFSYDDLLCTVNRHSCVLVLDNFLCHQHRRSDFYV